MTFPSDVATARAAGHNVSRQLFVGTDTLLLLKGNGPYTTLATLTTNWDLGRHEYQDVEAGPRYFKLFVEDLQGDRLTHLKTMTAVRIKGMNYKIIGKDSFTGSVPSYEFKVQAIGEQLA